ncbi:hypothetical protein BGX28_004443 [Mortierella sp. GBA30]|nr:hypothetical protein BGX28_004443 [Mortierella sp. GBA30]
MSPRAVRSATKKASSAVAPKARRTKIKREPESDGDFVDRDEEMAEVPDDDDSDEYVGSDANPENDDDDDDGVDMAVDEDEDGLGTPEPKKRRRRAVLKSFSVSLEEMNKLLSTHDDSKVTSTAAGASNLSSRATTNTDDLQLTQVTLPRKVAQTTPAKRASRASRPKRPLHKKGIMHDSEMIPDIWKLSYRAPTSDELLYVSMQESVLRATSYPNIASSEKDFRVYSEPSEVVGLPDVATTRIHAREGEIEVPTMAAHYMKTTDKTGVNDCYILNTGVSVWALDWCPLPSYEDEPEKNMNYVAIGGLPDTAENCIIQEQLFPLGKQEAHLNMIQIWSLNCNTDDQGELQSDPKGYLALCIVHSYGAVLDLKWCPTGNLKEAGSAPDELDRLGILAASFSDGTIRIFSVPEPSSLRAKLGRTTAQGTNPDPVYIEYPEPHVTIRMGDICFMSISWGTAERLAAGATNGTVPIWDMKSMLSQSRETLAERESEYLDPVYLPQVHDVSVRSVDWFRNEDPEVVPWIIVSSGYDGRVRYTDLHDIYGPIDIKTILGVPMVSTCIPWAEGCVYIDVDFGAKLDQLYLESRGFRMFNAQGTIWDLSYSDYQPFLAAAISDGRVKISNPAYKARRGYGMVQNHVYQVQEVGADETAQSCHIGDGTDDSGQVVDETRTRNTEFRYQEGEEKEYISKSAGFLSFYGANVAIQKVQWSRCYHSAAWLASGSAGGLVRIDNTMLRKEEGGEGNKIAYEPEAYLMKRRLASGLPPKGKIGRPRKIRDPAEADVSKKGKQRGGRKKKAPSKAKSRKGQESEDEEGEGVEEEEEEEAAESESDEGEEVVGGGDEDEFMTRRKTTGKATVVSEGPSPARRTTRLQTGKLAPIFTRMGSTNASDPSQTPSDEEGNNEEEHHSGEDVESSSPPKTSPRKPAAKGQLPPKTIPSKEPTTSKRPRGRPKKNAVAIEVDAAESTSQTQLSITRAKRGKTGTVAVGETESVSNDAEGEAAMADATAGIDSREGQEDVRMEDAGESPPMIVAVTGKGKGKDKKATKNVDDNGKSSRPDPPTALPITMEPQLSAAAAIAAVAAAVEAEDRCRSHGALAAQPPVPSIQLRAGKTAELSTKDNMVTGSDDTPRSGPSSRASSEVPSSPRKARGPSSRAKKQIEENRKQNRSLKDFWGGAASAAKDK